MGEKQTSATSTTLPLMSNPAHRKTSGAIETFGIDWIATRCRSRKRSAVRNSAMRAASVTATAAPTR
jgi:hypothetical protein